MPPRIARRVDLRLEASTGISRRSALIKTDCRGVCSRIQRYASRSAPERTMRPSRSGTGASLPARGYTRRARARRSQRRSRSAERSGRRGDAAVRRGAKSRSARRPREDDQGSSTRYTILLMFPNGIRRDAEEHHEAGRDEDERCARSLNPATFARTARSVSGRMPAAKTVQRTRR